MTVVAILSLILGVAATTLYFNRDLLPDVARTGRADLYPQVREYEMDITTAEIQMGEGLVWRAWTFNGTVPGPTLTAMVGDTLKVTIHNKLDLTHSFHTHLSPYPLESDGSQLNSITGIGGLAMVPPGKSYTYSFSTTVPGIFYYHCHSADGGKTISQHMSQGLYGAIIVKGYEEIPVRDEVVFMSERGFDADSGAPYFLMNGHGLPGGEHKLEEIAAKEGVPGVAAQFGTTIPVIKGKVGEPVRLSIINIGDQIHSFHLHAMTAYYVDIAPGTPVTAQVLGLVPGEAGRMLVTPTNAGIWLFHCHVVNHADSGMIGVFVVDPA